MLWLVIGVVAVAAFGAALLIIGHRRRAALAPEVRRAIASAQAARKELYRIQLAHRKNASQATKHLEFEQDPRGRRLKSQGGVVLYERYIETPQGSGPLVGIVATAADASQVVQRLTVTRMIGLGVFSLAAPKKKAVGNAYVIIEGPSVSGVATFSAESSAGSTAYQFAAVINNAARADAKDETERPARIAASAKDLEAALDRSKVVAAEQLFDAAVAALPPAHRAKFMKNPRPAPQPDDVDRVDDADLITDHD